jgi:hypothetical protein
MAEERGNRTPLVGVSGHETLVPSKSQPQADLLGLSDSPGVLGHAWVSPAEPLRGLRAHALEFRWET